MEKKTFRRKPGRPSKNVFTVPDPDKQAMTGAPVVPPMAAPQAEVMRDEEKRFRMSRVLNQYARTINIQPVRSNAELQERGQDYFRFCADRRLYPTVEGLASFCGYSSRQLLRWERGEVTGFKDGSITTAEIVERLKGIIDSMDADLVLGGEIPSIPWIFRRKVLNQWAEATRLELVNANDTNERQPLSAEEIMRRLPDPDDDYMGYSGDGA